MKQFGVLRGYFHSRDRMRGSFVPLCEDYQSRDVARVKKAIEFRFKIIIVRGRTSFLS